MSRYSPAWTSFTLLFEKSDPYRNRSGIPLRELLDPPLVAALSFGRVEQPVAPDGEEGVAPPDDGVLLGLHAREQTRGVAEDVAADELVAQLPVARPVLCERTLAAPAFELALPGALDRLRVERLGRGAVPQVVVRRWTAVAEEVGDECREVAPVPSPRAADASTSSALVLQSKNTTRVLASKPSDSRIMFGLKPEATL